MAPIPTNSDESQEFIVDKVLGPRKSEISPYPTHKLKGVTRGSERCKFGRMVLNLGLSDLELCHK